MMAGGLVVASDAAQRILKITTEMKKQLLAAVFMLLALRVSAQQVQHFELKNCR